MKNKFIFGNFIVMAAMVLVSCTPKPIEPGQPYVDTEDMMEEKSVDAHEPVEQAPAESSQIVLPGWFSSELTDVKSGSVFRVADFLGKVVLMETMATWCPKCLSQQKEVARLHELLGDREDFVSLGINVDANENATQLGDYVRENGFDWLYIVASAELINEISNLYGNQYLNPPATPLLIIDRQGKEHLLPFGIKSAEELQTAIQPFLDEV